MKVACTCYLYVLWSILQKCMSRKLVFPHSRGQQTTFVRRLGSGGSTWHQTEPARVYRSIHVLLYMHFLVCIQIPDFAETVSSTTLPNMWEVKLGWKAGNSRKATPGVPVSVQLLYSLRLLVSNWKECSLRSRIIFQLSDNLFKGRIEVHTLFFQRFGRAVGGQWSPKWRAENR